MNALQAFAASLEASRRQAAADHHAAPAVEHVTIEPPVWCHACGQMLAVGGHLGLAGAPSQITALCAQCAAAQAPHPDRRQPSERQLRELVTAARLLAWLAEDRAGVYDDRGCVFAADILRDLAAATDRAIEGLRQ